jgi:hypothetical protein
MSRAHCAPAIILAIDRLRELGFQLGERSGGSDDRTADAASSRHDLADPPGDNRKPHRFETGSNYYSFGQRQDAG